MNHKAMFDSYVSGMSSEQVAEKFGVSSQTVRTAVKKIDATKIRKPGRYGPRKPPAQPVTFDECNELEPQGDALSVTPTPAE